MEEKPMIVVVDDEADILDNYKNLLSDDYRVRAYQDPQTFLKEVETADFKTPDLLITDLKMPTMDGLEMVRKVQSKGHYFPFILLTGFLNKQAAIDAVNIGVYRLMEKPAEFSVLSKAIEQLLVEYEIQRVRNSIREITAQLREYYSGIRLALTQYIPEEVFDRVIVDAAPDGRVKQKMSFESLLESLETRLESLLTSEKELSELRHQRLKV